MATKGDLIEAQNFSRRRLLTAFISGAPGGKELEPSSPMRAVIAAIALTALVVLVGLFYGFIKPGLPSGWENGKLILVSDTGARFVTVDGVLHPVINTASARLLLPSAEFDVLSTEQQNLEGTRIGDTLGIVGAPDELPAPDRLSNTGWSACVTDDGALDVRIGGAPLARAEGRAAVVESDGNLYVIDGGRSFAVADNSDAVLRAAGITSLDPVTVPTDWLNLFTPGTPLGPLVVDGAGGSVEGTDLPVGTVVHQTGAPDTERLLVQSDGTLAALTPLAWQLYLLGSGSGSGEPVDVTTAETAALDTAARPAGGEDWPDEGFQSIATDQRACAALVSGDGQATTALATQDASTGVTAGVNVEPGSGALVRAGGRGVQNTGIVTLVDATGRAYPLPGATEETVLRLGYTADSVGAVSDGWTELLPTGPALSEAAAGLPPTAEAP
ncbi:MULTISPECIES: type VII secretion protein EccB [unclassified Microbacterium]|uniref:type VII secretion protein EccB n=1 Tax=unclassified Microbacterium TaxID=2609290 RepID=UPI0037467073